MIRRLDYGSFIVSNYWRTEAPYQQAFIASNGTSEAGFLPSPSGYTLVESPSLIDPTWTPVTPTNQWPSQKTGWTGSLDAATRFYDLVPTP